MEIRKHVIIHGFLVILCSIVLLSIVPQYAHAYSLLSYKMDSQIWYHASDYFKETTRNDMRDAMREWNVYIPEYRRLCYDTATHNESTYIFPNHSDGQNRIYKSSTSDDRSLAENICWRTSSYILVESDIIINVNKPWNNGAHPNEYDVKSVFKHELGHTLGIGESQYLNAVMYRSFYTNKVKVDLINDDISALNARYN